MSLHAAVTLSPKWPKMYRMGR